MTWLLTALLLLGGCAHVPTEQEVLTMPEQEFRLWVREAVKDLRTGQWMLLGVDAATGAALFIFLPPIVKAAASKGAATAMTTGQ